MIGVRFSSFAIAGLLSLSLATPSLAAKSKAKSKTSKKSSAKAKPSPTPAAKPSPSPTPNQDWQVIKVGPRDYLTVDNIAKFYGLIGNVDSTGKIVVLNNGRNQLQVTLDSREAVVNGVRNWLCFPVIAKDDKFLVSRIDLAKTIEPQLRPQMLPQKGKVLTIVLDPGHGGFDKGARNNLGTEKDFALDVARKLRPMLQKKGFKVVLTRENDVFIPLHMRARIANATKDSIFVSLHFNGASNRDATGFEIFSLTPRGAPSTDDNALALHFVNMQAGSAVDAQSFALSATVFHSMLGHLPEVDRGIKRARFAVLRHTKIPAILVEGGFLTETDNSKRVADPAWREKFAEALSVGIENYRNLVEKKQRPMLVAEYRARAAGEINVVDLAAPPSRLEETPPPIVPVTNPAPTPTPALDPATAAPPDPNREP
ncbi:MAG TPA: N-acetylmuramoyl-L-alanine amidase [Chthoniobacterales bacterium]|nr:N-acetylmuramoyl-L-alanine amidase [Chthoniobacterales bacterium]